METITRKELKEIPKDYKQTIKKHLTIIKNYHGINEMEKAENILKSLGYDIEKDYYIFKNSALCPVHIIK